MKTFYVTTPIYYANSLPHLGHLYTTILADCVTRYRRQRGYETLFLTGTDEHGINVQRAAARSGRTPKEHVDYIVGELQQSFAAFGLDGAHGGYDIFMRTTEPFHYEAVAEFWRRVAAAKTPKGREAIYKGHYEGWFCAPCATFKTEDEYAKPEREGDPPLCLIHEAPLDRVAEESYFFRLSDYGEALLALYESRPGFISPDARLNEVVSFINSGLQDLSVSRLKSSVSWAIPVPGDPDHTIYIWLDALSNYITALGWGRAGGEGENRFEKFWPGTHFLGKDILRQHAIYWPAFLMAAGIEQPVAVIAHGTWLDHAGRKMSKTLGNSIELPTLRRHFSTDVVRYFALREMVFGQDSKFGYEALIDRSNSDLASGLGNLSSRTLTMINRYCDGRVPAPDIEEGRRLQAKRAGVDADAQALADTLEYVRNSFIQLFEDNVFHRAVEVAWTVIGRMDKIISDAKPWELAKDESQRQTLNAVLYRAAETLRWLAVILHPVMPDATRAIWSQLGQPGDLAKYDPAELQWGGLQAGTQIGEVAPVFPRIDKAKIMAEIEKENAAKEAAKTESSTPHSGTHATEADAVPGASNATETKPEPPQRGATEADAVPQAQGSGASENKDAPEGVATFIGIEDFIKVEMRVGEILTAERIPKSDKLLRFTIDLGEAAPRQILAGIAEYYEPETLVGRKVAVVSNLKPRKLRGFESQGMVLAASLGDEGRPVLATFTEDVPNGARLK
ncbi:MAG: methionyl-tRNA synthetase [Pyrinomonadaceae bacterium]|jgi:methionyl-tRNA synthetase|nr:methionyl-tRNA synthetase [Pyrinomonadaceae bacterium]